MSKRKRKAKKHRLGQVRNKEIDWFKRPYGMITPDKYLNFPIMKNQNATVYNFD